MLIDKKFNSLITELLFIIGRNLNISRVFITQSYFKVSKGTRRNTTHFFIMKIPNKKEFHQIAFNHLSDIDFKGSINLLRNVLQNHILFQLLMLLLHQIILHVLERIF